MPPPRQIQDSGEIENREPLSGRDALAALRAQVEGVTAEQRERHVQNIREYLDRTSATPEQRHQALDGLSSDFHTVLDIQSAQSRSVDNAYRLGKAFLENINRDQERGNIRFRVVFENEIHNATIGLGHILPPNVRRVAVTDLRGNVRIGERQADSRVGYFDGQGYIPVFNGYTVDVLTTVADNDQQVTEARNEERNYFQNLLRLQQQESRATLSADVEATRRGETPPTTLAESPQYREIIRKFAQAEIQLPEETLIYAERDLRDLRQHANLAEMLDSNTLEIFKLASFGGRIGNTEIKPPTHEGYDIRLKDIPLFHQFAMRLRDPIFSRTIVSILEREKRESEADSCTFENVYELIENAYVAKELVTSAEASREQPPARQRSAHEIEARILGSRPERFVAVVQRHLGISMTVQELTSTKSASESDFRNWFNRLAGNLSRTDAEYRNFRNTLYAIGKQESGGTDRYDLLGPEVNGKVAFGHYQIMDFNYAKDSRNATRALGMGSRVLAPNAYNQDLIATHRMIEIYKKYRLENRSLDGARRLTAAQWYGGTGGASAYDRGGGQMANWAGRNGNIRMVSIQGYVSQVEERFRRMERGRG